ncbi:hypothetical protein [Simiduia agarivorans]|uniref:Uncharacterized protein n=1 Tax=Simiduia agarivorans (strain DSM 21679 / JCM 13881 / BCRC 17597 / SA1) TaxID=1117647 RepID=K4KXW2_SIMAS|nr:hypothetical protein [Simiduia agarivorans]AFU98751.1 hypothetical protein M5M_07800 [Simiduia agarivorans SA1 = DSM 21679]
MSHPPRDHQDLQQEAILISLDQLSQTLEVMAKVVSRLKQQIAENTDKTQDSRAGGRRASDRQASNAFH